MFLTTKGRYAVMIAVELNAHFGKAPVSAQDMSNSLGIEIRYLEQILSKLKAAGLVASFRGPGGGYLLKKVSSEILIVDIMNAVKESFKLTRCNSEGLGGGCMADKRRCNTHDFWAAFERQIAIFLKNTTLESICNDGGLKALDKRQTVGASDEFSLSRL